MIEAQPPQAQVTANGHATVDTSHLLGVRGAFLLGWTVAELQGRIRIAALNERLGAVTPTLRWPVVAGRIRAICRS